MIGRAGTHAALSCPSLTISGQRLRAMALQRCQKYLKLNRVTCSVTLGVQKEKTEIQGYVQPTIPPPNPFLTAPLYIKVPLVLLAIAIAGRIWKRLTKRG